MLVTTCVAATLLLAQTDDQGYAIPVTVENLSGGGMVSASWVGVAFAIISGIGAMAAARFAYLSKRDQLLYDKRQAVMETELASLRVLLNECKADRDHLRGELDRQKERQIRDEEKQARDEAQIRDLLGRVGKLEGASGTNLGNRSDVNLGGGG